MNSAASLVTYSARPPMTAAAAFASLRSYYFRMHVCNWRARRIEACESQDCTAGQLREWFRQASIVARCNPFLASR